MALIRIHFFPVRIQDPDPDQNEMDLKHCNDYKSNNIFLSCLFIVGSNGDRRYKYMSSSPGESGLGSGEYSTGASWDTIHTQP